MSKSKSASVDWANTGAHLVKDDIHDIEPLLSLGTKRWTLWDSPLKNDEGGWRLVQKLVNEGVVKAVGEEAPSDRDGGEDDNAGYRTIYQWDETARQKLVQYRDTMPTLPCGCRTHVPPGGDYPNPWMRCKHCKAAHRKAVIREHI